MADDAPDAPDALPELYYACMANDLERVKRLLESGVSPNDGESIYHAAQENRRECLELMLAYGADLSARDLTHRNTPLHFLAGHRESDDKAQTASAGMTWLLDHGADLDVTSYDTEETPLHAVARTGWVALADLFLAHGAAVDAKRADGKTPYAVAVRSGSRELAALLRATGANPADVSPEDDFLGACMEGDQARAGALLSVHPDLVRHLAADGRGAVVQGVYERSEAAIRLMTGLGFDLSWESSWAGTPLHHAAWLGEAGLVRVLLDLGAPVDAKDRQFGSSALGWTAHGSSNYSGAGADHPAVVSLLLDAGASYAASINRWGEPPMGMASPGVQEVFRSRGLAP
jgi:ankyrin repeat protein